MPTSPGLAYSMPRASITTLTAFSAACRASKHRQPCHPATLTAIAGASDEDLREPWSLRSGGAVLFTRPKAVVLRSFVLNHVVHHRAQLGVYLRLNDVPVPSLYGPSADESVAR